LLSEFGSINYDWGLLDVGQTGRGILPSRAFDSRQPTALAYVSDHIGVVVVVDGYVVVASGFSVDKTLTKRFCFLTCELT
jgi:hypothetical protein